MRNIISFFKSKPVFFILLPVYFVFHGFAEYYKAIPLKDALWLLLEYIIATFVIFILGWLFYRQVFKAAIFSFCIIAFDFFFGNIKDSLTAFSNNSFISSYSFLLPFFFISFIFLFWRLKKSKFVMNRFGFYLNMLLCILMLFDAAWLTKKILQRPSANHYEEEFAFRCDSCTKPDIYFLVFDEYSSSTALKEVWNYDNSDLDTFLLNKGFKLLTHSRSNYNFTEFSIASTLNMDFLNIPTPAACTLQDYNRCFEKINSNRVCSVLSKMGYDVVNNSIFDLQNISSQVKDGFLPLKTKLISSQTFTGRVFRDLIPHLLVGRFKIEWLSKYLFHTTHRNNQKIIVETVKEASTNSTKPKFVYSHIEMPHSPFYFDKHGRDRSIEEMINIDITSYLDYLPNTNEVIKKIVPHIFDHSKRPFVIVLMGDHGFREGQTKDFQFKNLNAVYLSSGNYLGFYDSITNVNEYRVLFNNLFHSSLTMKKDSTIFLQDKQ